MRRRRRLPRRARAASPSGASPRRSRRPAPAPAARECAAHVDCGEGRLCDAEGRCVARSESEEPACSEPAAWVVRFGFDEAALVADAQAKLQKICRLHPQAKPAAPRGRHGPLRRARDDRVQPRARRAAAPRRRGGTSPDLGVAGDARDGHARQGAAASAPSPPRPAGRRTGAPRSWCPGERPRARRRLRPGRARRLLRPARARPPDGAPDRPARGRRFGRLQAARRPAGGLQGSDRQGRREARRGRRRSSTSSTSPRGAAAPTCRSGSTS